MPKPIDILEAVLFAADTPLSAAKLAAVCELDESLVQQELEMLSEEKNRIGALQLVQVAGGWQMVTKPDLAPWVSRLREEKKAKLSRAAFEVLAIVAYRQPTTRSEVEELRGVDCARSLGMLLEKNLVMLAGRKEAPGRPWLYTTSFAFLDHFGLRSVEDLPPLDEFTALLEGEAALQLFDKAPLQSETPNEIPAKMEDLPQPTNVTELTE
ncbi:MAG: SMC-Scp complex subunit ScpB [Abditibacteriaceae bacterium]